MEPWRLTLEPWRMTMEIKIIIAYSSVVHISLIIVSLLLLRKVGLIGAWKPTMERWRPECRSSFVYLK
jgi:hypothetical protein